MLPVPTSPKLQHKSSRGDLGEPGYGDTRARETEQKRVSGKISCAECTRLKTKCDKKVPCQSCRRRGCAALCPNGQRSRFVVAATEPLHRRIAEMSERNRQLEDALRELQAKHTTEQHPLLRSELSGASGDTTVVERTPDLLEALGTLSISDTGVSRFFGPTGGSHCLLMVSWIPAYLVCPVTIPSRSMMLPPKVRGYENVTPVFPFKPTHSSLSVETLANNYLPTWDRAHYLTEVYREHASWLFPTVSNDQIVLELLPDYYSNGAPHAMQAKHNRHRLGLLFLVFAIAAFIDPNRELGNAEAELYHEVARATICLHSVVEKPTLETIQLLHFLSVYNTISGNELAGKETSTETSWSLVALAAHLAHTVNRDGLKWGLSADVTARRRVVFWNLFVVDVWNSLETGRPPTFSLPYIDCQFPGGGSPDVNGHIDTNREVFWASWVFRFASSCAADVAARTLTSDSPSYSTILELDRKVCNFPVPANIEEFVATACGAIPMKPADKDIGLTESLGRFVMSTSREVTITENPINPLNSSYARSFRAAYRASLIILRIVKVQYDLHPRLTAVLWPLWSYAFSAAVVFGTIVTHGPRSPMAPSSMEELRNAWLLFSKASPCNRRAQKALPIITRLMEKAQNALLRAQSDIPHELGQQWLIDENEGDDELAIFAGRTKIVFVKRHTTDGMSSSPAFMPQHKQVQVESVGEELHSGPAASLEQTQEMPTWDRSLYPDTASQSTAPLRTPHVPTLAPGEPMVVPSCTGEELGSRWLQQPGSVAGLGQIQEMSIWDRTLFSDVPSKSTLRQPSAPSQIPSQVPSARGEVAAGSSTGAWSRELSDPYLANVSAPCTQAYPQGYHLPHGRAGTHHHQNWPQSHPPTHSEPPQPQTIPLVPAELAQLGLVTQESGLGQRWVSFMHESGFFDG
ncbi:hypothetical protein EDD15DRAFT_2388334 [Pisolithus albus]|nr:hypothetical protein EDD15DRAFT_2388334 [Pisolithus albus]